MNSFPYPNRRSLLSLLLALAVPCSIQAQNLSERAQPIPPVRAKHAMVVTIHHEATDAGVAILKQGGNAVDAAVAVGFALAVVYPPAGNIGGGGFMLVRLHNGATHFLDYREKAPAAASQDMYLDAAGNVIPNKSIVGPLAVGVPGTVAGLAYAQAHYGRLTLKQDMAPAIRLATEGYVLSPDEAAAFHSRSLTRFAASARIFQRNGNFYKPGDTFRQPELAATLTRIANDPAEFYHGAMARQIAAFMSANGGILTAADLAAYQVKERAPLTGNYRGYQVITAPPPSSGGIALLETLNILSGYNLAAMGDRTPQQIHYITEAFRRAYMDRTDYLGDPDFTTLPLQQLASPKYAAAWRSSIYPVKPTPSATLVRPAGFIPEPPRPATSKQPTETTHFSIVDADGNAVSSTYTLNNSFGSAVTVDGLGFLLNDEMDDFSAKINTPNMFGLIQSPANAIDPGKRPLSCMTPTIVLQHGRLRLLLGSPGGATIISTVANDLISVLDNGLDIQQAADAPRFHHQYLPDELQIEKNFPAATAATLAATGYHVVRAGALDEKNPGLWGDSELIAIDPVTGELSAGHDHRHHFGKAAGY
ncbi:MAG: gamma-glutamyltransferase [Acidobacteriaceae bacterium]|nr:gamma-glutamyltransferase [Acidobacteriaceae bacterium]